MHAQAKLAAAAGRWLGTCSSLMRSTRPISRAAPSSSFGHSSGGFPLSQHLLENPVRVAFAPVPVERIDGVLDGLVSQLCAAHDQVNGKFGVSCWHESDYESDAMWKLYSASGQRIAIESTVGQLRESLGNRTDLIIDRVRYMDFEQDPIEKGHRHYRLFVKRKSFEHEKTFGRLFLYRQNGRVFRLIAISISWLRASMSRRPPTPLYETLSRRYLSGNKIRSISLFYNRVCIASPTMALTSRLPNKLTSTVVAGRGARQLQYL